MTMDPTRQLERDLKDIVRHAPGRLSIQVVGPQGILAGWDADRQVPAASLIKVLVLLATLHEVDRGRLSLDQQLQVPARRVGGAGALSLLPTITELSVIELLRLMITLSDNDAANLLLQLLGHERVTRCATDLGLTQTVVQRDLMDPAAAESGRDNLTTAADQAGLLAVLRSGHAVGESSTRLALALLGEQQHAYGVTALLPDQVVRGSKPADLPGLRHDVALIEAHGSWRCVAVTATDMYDRRHEQDYSVSVLPALAAVGEAVLSTLVPPPPPEE
ncbi:serine hydrolase [Arsenicicoccus dermatophilus]|uniref:serine hydrolase n=1 Tax=Arsenicicoccus dermatophilus TaxID=1076331 RepID=UPI001F4C798B|nr:serine hydrolase [Arsenicicoccus dermatophilus]MCH8613081.1 class A beta-lactamase-related serine hydrolase [Arsenicicoccus dermatophilus]